MKKTLLLITLLLICPSFGPCSGQAIDTIEPDPPGTIDGSKNPELIPDNIAYELFYRTICNNPNGWDLETRKASLKNTQLSDPQVEILIHYSNIFANKMANLDQKSQEIRERHELGSIEANNQLREIHQQRIQLVESTTAALSKALLPRGARLFEEYVMHEVKRKIKMLPD